MVELLILFLLANKVNKLMSIGDIFDGYSCLLLDAQIRLFSCPSFNSLGGGVWSLVNGARWLRDVGDFDYLPTLPSGGC